MDKQCRPDRSSSGQHRFFRPRIRGAFLFPLLLLCGCAGYQIGQQTLYPSNIRTVHVPVFESETYRRNLGERLTEAVIKEMEQRSFKVADAASADSVLRGKIVDMTKRVLFEDIHDVPRNLEARFSVEVLWIDRFGNELAQARISYDANFLPEAGQSISTAQQEAIQRTARQIVSQMEVRW